MSLCGCAEVHVGFDFGQKHMLPLVLLNYLGLVLMPHARRGCPKFKDFKLPIPDLRVFDMFWGSAKSVDFESGSSKF
jgi:hypothetical protein